MAVLAGCGAAADPAAGPCSAPQIQGTHNDADVRFAQGMIPHHRQAVEMAELAAGPRLAQGVGRR